MTAEATVNSLQLILLAKEEIRKGDECGQQRILHYRQGGTMLALVKKTEGKNFPKMVREHWDISESLAGMYIRLSLHWDFIVAKLADQGIPLHDASLRECLALIPKQGRPKGSKNKNKPGNGPSTTQDSSGQGNPTETPSGPSATPETPSVADQDQDQDQGKEDGTGSTGSPDYGNITEKDRATLEEFPDVLEILGLKPGEGPECNIACDAAAKMVRQFVKWVDLTKELFGLNLNSRPLTDKEYNQVLADGVRNFVKEVSSKFRP